MSCRCRGACRCEPRIFWTLGESLCLPIDCPSRCDNRCDGCVAHDKLLASSKLTIYHPCFIEPIAELTDVVTIARCGCTLDLPATISDVTDKLKDGCEYCGLKAVLTVEIYESEPIENESLPATCKQILWHGEFIVDWSLNGVI